MSKHVYFKRDIPPEPSKVTPEATSAAATPLLTDVEGKLDGLNQAVSGLTLALELKADVVRVSKVEKAISGLRWQFYAATGMLAAAQVWLYWMFKAH